MFPNKISFHLIWILNILISGTVAERNEQEGGETKSGTQVYLDQFEHEPEHNK